MEAWVSFDKVRQALELPALLAHHHITLKQRGQQFTGACPIPGHGTDRRKTFSANAEKKVFRCFKCGAQGNLLDLAVFLAGRDPNDPKAVRTTALELQREFVSQEVPPQRPRQAAKQLALPPPQVPVLINPELDFELKDLDPTHPYLTGRGFTPETMRHFGVGYCGRGFLKGRIATPLHDPTGKLVGYAGRSISDQEEPKYLFPGERKREGKIIRFEKTKLLYNAHRIRPPVEMLFIVEGFASVWWLHQNGFPNTVALMGDSASLQQTDLIIAKCREDGRLWILADGDKAGRNCAMTLAPQLARNRFTRIVELSDGSQPTDLSAGQLQMLIGLRS